ncbi:MAG: alpha/beta hydrolase [Bacteroidales bacterium]
MIEYNKYFKSDDSDWLVFIHGAGGSSTIWFKQIKYFSKKYNVLLVDLRGHGKSNSFALKDLEIKKYSFAIIVNDVLEILDYEKIDSAHFAGISLGTIIIRQLSEEYPQRVKSMVLGGAIIKFNIRSKILMKFGFIFKSLLPYMMLYKFFAFIIMPKANHKLSRNLFIREAQKIYRTEFIRWYRMTTNINPLLKLMRDKELPIPTLYVMGEEDYMFLPAVRNFIAKHNLYSRLVVLKNCGHVVNIDRPDDFNKIVSDFLISVIENKFSKSYKSESYF